MLDVTIVARGRCSLAPLAQIANGPHMPTQCILPSKLAVMTAVTKIHIGVCSVTFGYSPAAVIVIDFLIGSLAPSTVTSICHKPEACIGAIVRYLPFPTDFKEIGVSSPARA